MAPYVWHPDGRLEVAPDEPVAVPAQREPVDDAVMLPAA